MVSNVIRYSSKETLKPFYSVIYKIIIKYYILPFIVLLIYSLIILYLYKYYFFKSNPVYVKVYYGPLYTEEYNAQAVPVSGYTYSYGSPSTLDSIAYVLPSEKQEMIATTNKRILTTLNSSTTKIGTIIETKNVATPTPAPSPVSLQYINVIDVKAKEEKDSLMIANISLENIMFKIRFPRNLIVKHSGTIQADLLNKDDINKLLPLKKNLAIRLASAGGSSVATMGASLQDSFCSNQEKSAVATLFASNFDKDPSSSKEEDLKQKYLAWVWSITPRETGSEQEINIKFEIRCKADTSRRILDSNTDLGMANFSINVDREPLKWIWGEVNITSIVSYSITFLLGIAATIIATIFTKKFRKKIKKDSQ